LCSCYCCWSPAAGCAAHVCFLATYWQVIYLMPCVCCVMASWRLLGGCRSAAQWEILSPPIPNWTLSRVRRSHTWDSVRWIRGGRGLGHFFSVIGYRVQQWHLLGASKWLIRLRDRSSNNSSATTSAASEGHEANSLLTQNQVDYLQPVDTQPQLPWQRKLGNPASSITSC